jgi:entericidin B
MLKIIAAVAFATIMLTGCETVKGMGKDVSSAGSVVTGSAAETQEKM